MWVSQSGIIGLSDRPEKYRNACLIAELLNNESLARPTQCS